MILVCFDMYRSRKLVYLRKQHQTEEQKMNSMNFQTVRLKCVQQCNSQATYDNNSLSFLCLKYAIEVITHYPTMDETCDARTSSVRFARIFQLTNIRIT